MKFFNTKKVFHLLILLGVILSFCIVFSPRIHYKIGNIFFGGVPSLYNIKLANTFYYFATHSLFQPIPIYAHYQLSRTYFIQGELEKALLEAKNELELYPENTRTYYIIGLTYGYLNKEEEAIDAFGHFIQAYPTSWAARNDRAWLQFRLGDIQGALSTIEPISGMLNPWVQNTYGTILLNSNRKSEAKQAFLRAEDIVSDMTVESWGIAYPGNDPRIYDTGLRAMKKSIEGNLKLLINE